jgi:hypothetical protein
MDVFWHLHLRGLHCTFIIHELLNNLSHKAKKKIYKACSQNKRSSLTKPFIEILTEILKEIFRPRWVSLKANAGVILSCDGGGNLRAGKVKGRQCPAQGCFIASPVPE